MGAGEESITVRLQARAWATIDAEVDNVVSLAVVNGAAEVVRIGSAIRQAGWDQVPWVGDQWPPDDQVVQITLSRKQWRFAIRESVVLGRDAVAIVTDQLS